MVKFLRKLGLELINFVFNNTFSFWIMRTLGIFQAVFVVYPASQNYAKHFAFQFRLNRNKWSPFIIGFVTHPDGSRSLSMAISATEDEIMSSNNGDSLRDFNSQTIEIKKSIGAASVHYAGVIPAWMKRRFINRDQVEQLATVNSVVKAVIAQTADSVCFEVIVLGHKGYIGSEVIKRLRDKNFKVFGVEKGEKFVAPTCPHIVVNITTPEAVMAHLYDFTKNTIILNEVYPAPRNGALKKLKEKVLAVNHICGVQAKAFPAFPAEYAGGVPCCGALPHIDYRILVKNL